MKLYGKELDDELAKRKQAREERRSQKLKLRDAAKAQGIDASELAAFENGYDLCPHLEFEDSTDFHFKFMFMVCKKCGMTKPESMEKVTDANINRAYDVFKRVAAKEDVMEWKPDVNSNGNQSK